MTRQVKRVAAESEKATQIYQVQILLSGSEPPIWRRLQVPATASLGWFHAVLQVAMGWTNSHLHQFICGEHTYADPRPELGGYGGGPPVRNENKFTLKDVLKEVHDDLVYEYDFGDSWEHIVTLEKILPADAPTPVTPLCLAGSRACPPENCGGIWGYVELLKALKNRKHPEHRSMKEWLGRTFDSECFELTTTNTWLRKLKWPRVTESQLRRILMARDGYHE
jgi:hypothetical protein